MCDLHHASPVRMLKIAEVKMQALRQTVHAVYVEQLLEVIFGAGMHGVTLVVPSCGLHHDRRVVKPRRLGNGRPGGDRLSNGLVQEDNQ